MSLIYSAGYFGIIFLMFIENIFPPIPSEFIMPLAGFMAGEDKFSLLIVFGLVIIVYLWRVFNYKKGG